MGVPLPRIRDALGQLRGSFLRVATVNDHETWAFAHPTIADALTDILTERSHMMAALLRGATIDTILGSFVCEGARHVRDAPTIPPTLDDTLIGRLARVPDETSTNWSLFGFLADRASDHVSARCNRRSRHPYSSIMGYPSRDIRSKNIGIRTCPSSWAFG
jgi:hypothetical protein